MATKYVSTTNLQYFKNKLDSIFAKKTDLPKTDSSLNSTSTNPVQNKVVYTEIESLKKSVSDGKTELASAITEKGVSTASNATFVTMASNISNIRTESILTGDAISGNVLSGKTFYNTDAKTKVTGTMANNGAVSTSVAVGGSYTIPAGYHNGSGKVTGPTLSGDATAGNVLNSKTFYSNSGTKQTGTMANNGAVSTSVAVGGSYTIPAGYHNGSGKVTGPTLSGNATAADVASGKTFYSNSGTKHTGTLVLNFPSGYKLMTGSKNWESINLADNGIIPIYLYWYCAGTQWTSFPSDVYIKDNNGKTYGSCHVNGNSSGSSSGYKSIWELYNGNWDSMKTIKTFSITGSQSPNGSVSIKVWLQKV